MKTLLSFAVVMIALCPCAFSDYYRATGGGVYELYVDDCSPTGMRRALDNAVAARRAVITTVKCAPVAPVPMPQYDEIYMETIPAEWLCPCVQTVSLCGC